MIDRSQLVSSKQDITANLQSAIKHVLAKKEISDWEAFALERAGVTVPATYLPAAEQSIKENQGNFRKVTDLERMGLGIAAAGQDPTAFAGYNLIEKIYNHERLTMQGTNGIIFALIALDSQGYEPPAEAKWNRTSLITWLLAQQNQDGGWALVAGNESSVDLTGMALAALSPYQDQTVVANAIKKAVDWLFQTTR